jgi:hypothetical protein
LEESRAWVIAVFGLIALLIGCVTSISGYFQLRDASSLSKLEQGFFAIQSLQNMGVHVNFLFSLSNLDSFDPKENSVPIPANYTITEITSQGYLRYFLQHIEEPYVVGGAIANNITTVYFAPSTRSPSGWVLAYAHIFPQFQGAIIEYFPNDMYNP